MPEPLRVAVVARAVLPLHGAGGLERSVHDLVVHLAARGVEVTLISPPPRPAHVSESARAFDDRHVTQRTVPYTTFPGANRRGTTILDRSTAYLVFGERAGRMALAMARDRRVDIVHGFGASVLGYARARRRTTVPLVFNPQGLEEFGATSRLSRFKALGYLPLQRAVLTCARAADCVIATDTSLESTVVRHLAPRAGALRTIPNGIDLAVVDAMASPADVARLRRDAGLGPDDLILLSVGRLEANKGFDVLADALGRLSRTGAPLSARRWRWIVVGDGPGRRALERAVDMRGIGAHVDLLGRLNDRALHAWYETTTLFVHPTRYEGSSLVTLEAMAHRRPIVATRAGGLPDKVRPGVNGWLATPGDAGSLAEALTEALAAGERLASMGVESRRLVEREFAWSVLGDRWLALYRELRGSEVFSTENA